MGSFLQKIINWFKSLIGMEATDDIADDRPSRSPGPGQSSPDTPAGQPKNAGLSVPSSSTPLTDSSTPPDIPNSLKQTLYKSFYSLNFGDDWVGIGQLGKVIRKHDRQFSPTSYGFQKLSDLLETTSELVEFDRANARARLADPADTKALLRQACQNISPENEWIHLASLGDGIKQLNGRFSASKYGFGKFKDWVAYHSELIELKKDNSIDYVRLRGTKQRGGKGLFKPSSKKVIKSPVQSQNGTRIPIRSKRPSRRIIPLTEYAFIPDEINKYHRLAALALEEQWYFGPIQPSKFPYPILRNYIAYTFIRLQYEDKIAVSSDKSFSAFNTGLLDHKYEPIYALFGFDKQGREQDWYLIDFCVAGQQQEGKTLVNNIHPLPQSADYFTRPADMFYDIHAGAPQVDWLHVIRDRPDRLPLEFLRTYCPRGFEPRDVKTLPPSAMKEYRQQFTSALDADASTFRAIKAQCEKALDFALLKTQLNYRTAIPYYNPRKNRLQLLLPLALISEETVDCALVVDRTPNARQYIGYTILPLSWAYSNARQVIRLETPWLSANLTEHGTESDESDDEDAAGDRFDEEE